MSTTKSILRSISFLCLLIVVSFACRKPKELSSVSEENWTQRTVGGTLSDSLKSGSTYLSVYSQIYSETEHKTHPLTGTISMRNANRSDTIYITKAEYFNTYGQMIRAYFDKPIFIAPMETVEIVIDQEDNLGGTGANFIFEWVAASEYSRSYFRMCHDLYLWAAGAFFHHSGVSSELIYD